MAANDLGVEVPASTDMFDPDGDMRDLGDSLAGRIIVPVANATERDALATTLSPSSSEPLYVHRADAPIQKRFEWTEDGSTWQHVGGNATAAGSGTSPTIAAANTTYLTAITFPAGRFSTPPIVVPTFVGAVTTTSTTTLWAESVTTSGANIGIRRSITSAGFPFGWTAIEPD